MESDIRWLQRFSNLTKAKILPIESKPSFGLKHEELAFLQKTFMRFSDIQRVQIFGSRAKGNFSTHSDIDIAYSGELSHRDFSQLWSILTDEAPFLYRVDILSYEKCGEALRDHIDRVGKTVYQQ